MDDESIGREIGLFDPDRADRWEFLAARVGGFDRQSAGHGTKTLVLTDGAKEARALEGSNFRQTLAVVLRHQHAKTGKANVADIGVH